MSQKLEIEVCDLGGGWVEAYYFELQRIRAMCIQIGVPPERVRLYELVAHGLEHVPRRTRRLTGHALRGGFVFLRPRDAREPDALAVRATSEVLEELEPEWIAAVEDARRFADSPEVITAWCGVPVEAVLAVLGAAGRKRP